MPHRSFLGVLALVSLCVSGCSSQSMVAPTPPTPAPGAPPSEPRPCTFSSLFQPGRVYVFVDSAVSANVDPITRCSRFVLFEDGRFTIQFGEVLAFGGTYTISGEEVEFRWPPSPAAPVTYFGTARGTLVGDTLMVRYDEVMHGADYQDADYRLES